MQQTMAGGPGRPWKRCISSCCGCPPTLDKFLSNRKFILGDRIETTTLDVLEALIAATCTRGRDRMLAEANLGIEMLRFHLR